MKSVTRIVVLLALCAIVAPAFAGGGEWTNKLRFGVSYFSPTGDGTGSFEYADDPGYVITHVKAKVNGGVGVQVAFEHKFSPLIGLEINAGYYKPKFELQDVDNGGGVWSSNGGKAKVTPIGLALNFHVVNNDRLDFYVGPAVAYMMYGKPSFGYIDSYNEVEGTLTIKLKNELAYGIQAGADFNLSPKWDVAVRLSYLHAKGEIDEIRDDFIDTIPVKAPGDVSTIYETLSDDFSPNPITFTVAAGYKF